MPDYSGYAQRQQQDPNLAAWANISGNLANIFGLDPAKAADARRGIQQEDYQAQRNAQYLKQMAANKRIGELLAGDGFDASTGEFRDPVSFQEYVRSVADLHPEGLGSAMHLAPGFAKRAQENRIAQIQAENAGRAERESKEIEARNAAALKREAAARSSKYEREYRNREKTGHGEVASISPEDVATEFAKFFTGSPFVSGGATREMTKADGTKEHFITEEFAKALDKAGYDKTVPTLPAGMKWGKSLENDKAKVAAQIKRIIPNISKEQLVNLVESAYARHAAGLQSMASRDFGMNAYGPEDIRELVKTYDEIKKANPNDPRLAGYNNRYVIIRRKVMDGLRSSDQYERFDLGALLENRSDSENPLNWK